MTFTEWGGQGMAEEASGLPINSRRVHCDYAQGSASGNLEWIASDFYEEHCIGCEHRQPTGEVPNLATLVEDGKEDARAAAEARRVEAVRATAAWSDRAERRRALVAVSDPAMASALEDIGILDAQPGVDVDSASTDAALRRLVALAERAVDAFTPAVINLATDIVNSAGVRSLLGPLRIVARTRIDCADLVLDAALGALRVGPDIEAGRCLMDLSDRLEAASLDENVVHSLAYLAGMRRTRIPGLARQRHARDPGPLRVAVGVAPTTAEQVLRRMLPAPSSNSGLVLPPGQDRSYREDSDSEGDRAAAAESARALASTHPNVASALIADLVASLGVDGDDDYDRQPIGNVKRALATMLALGIGEVETHIERSGRNGSEEVRTRLFDVYEVAGRWVEANGSGREPGDPQLADDRCQDLFDTIASVAVIRVSGDWGENVAVSAAGLLEGLARSRPEWTFERRDRVLGAFLGAIDSMSNPPRATALLLPGEPAGVLSGLDEFARRSGYSAAARDLLGAIERCAGEDAVSVCETITKLVADERENERGVEVVWRLLGLLGRLGRAHGGEPGVLRQVLPALHTYLVDSEPALRMGALEAWTEIGAVHPLPGSLSDLLPAFVEDATVGVVEAVLAAARRLRWSEADRARLLGRALAVCRLVDAESHPDLLKSSMSTVAALAADLDEDLRVAAEKLIVHRSAELTGYDLRDVLRRRWLPSISRSAGMAVLRLRQARDPRINDRYNAGDDEELCALLDCGPGLVFLSSEDLVDAAIDLAPDSPLGSAEYAEVAWRAGRVVDAASVIQAVLGSTPNVPAFAGHRAILELLLRGAEYGREAGANGDVPSAVVALEAATVSADEEAGEAGERLCDQARTRIRIRDLLRGDDSAAADSSDEADSTSPMSSKTRRARADSLEVSAKDLDAQSQRLTVTGEYVRAVAGLCMVGVDLLRQDAAELDADPRGVDAHAVAARRRAEALRTELDSGLGSDDPLAGPLIEALADVDAIEDGATVASTLATWSALPMPFLVVDGPRPRLARPAVVGAASPAAHEEEEPSAAVVLASVDGRLITGPQVLRPSQVYEFALEVRPGSWPEWAEQLDAELLGHLSEAEIQTPTFTWERSVDPAQNETLAGAGTLVLRFGIAAGQPAPPFLVNLRWRGTRDGDRVSQAIDVAGHNQLRFRPFDASRDFLTDFPVFDERLLALYEQLHRAGYDEDHLQAFCRLFTAICRIGLRMTWDKKYKRGTSVSERKFHDDLHDHLLAEPELGGRVERGSPLALGFLDVRHDKVTAELKVVRRSPVTRESAPKYMGQPTQYAAADGARLSILCILDMSLKTSPVGTPENYMFTLEPAHHGLENPEAPSLVAVIVVNGNLPTPSSWSRRKTAERESER